jgi:uridine kinase
MDFNRVCAPALDAAAAIKRGMIVIDGVAGSGKTQLTELLSQQHPSIVVHLDDLYAGWEEPFVGQFTQRVLKDIVGPFVDQRNFTYRTYNWSLEQFDGLVEVLWKPRLIVEGVAAAQRALRMQSSLSIFLECHTATAKLRVLDRDAAASSTHIDAWQIKERHHFANDNTLRECDLVIRTSE